LNFFEKLKQARNLDAVSFSGCAVIEFETISVPEDGPLFYCTHPQASLQENPVSGHRVFAGVTRQSVPVERRLSKTVCSKPEVVYLFDIYLIS